MKNWKYKWKKELDALPPMREDVKSAPLCYTEKNKSQQRGFAYKKGWLGAVSCALVVVIICLCLPVIMSPAKSKNDYSVLMVEINPSAMFTVDDSGKVSQVVAVNAHADVILSDKDRVNKMVGLAPDKAINVFVDYCAKLGYLNLESPSAVRLTSCSKGKNYSTETTKTLSSYFKDLGVKVAVVERTLPPEEMSKMSGLQQTGSVKEFVEQLNSANNMYFERQENWSSSYDEAVEINDTPKGLIDSLNEHIEEIESSLTSLNHISFLSDLIYNHAQNPGGVLFDKLDYWNILLFNRPFDEYGEFGMLVEEMGSALNKYNTDYGVEIGDAVSLQAEILKTQVLLSSLKDLVLTAEVIRDNLQTIASLLGLGEEEQHRMEELYTVPETESEYMQKLNYKYDDRYDKNHAKYDQAVNSDTDFDYDGFIAEIISSYGSLDNYWDSLHQEN